jgi:hypothetical protein
VRKKVRVFPDRPAYVLGLVPDNKWYKASSVEADLEMFNRAMSEAPIQAGSYILLLNGSNRSLRKKMEVVAGAAIYGKSG